MRLTRNMTFVVALASCGWFAASARAQSFCDLLPASAVQQALGISGNLKATPNTEGGNGCDYKLDANGPTTVMADSTDDSGIYTTIFNQRLSTMKADARVSGIGDAAYYDQRNNQQIPSMPNKNFTQQSLVFRGKGKIVSFIVMLQGSGVPKAAILSLGALALSKPINTPPSSGLSIKPPPRFTPTVGE